MATATKKPLTAAQKTAAAKKKKAAAAKKKAAAAKTTGKATVVPLSNAVCLPSSRASAAGKRLYTYGDADAGRVLATVAKKEKAACRKEKGLAGLRRSAGTAKKTLSPGQKANIARMRMISTAATKIYDAPSNRLSYMECTKKASKQLKAAGRL